MGNDKQTVTINYSAKDSDGNETVGIDVRLSSMSLEDVRNTEHVLAQTLVALSPKA